MAHPGNELLLKVAPEFFVPSVADAVRFYVDKLDFRVLREDPDFAIVYLGRDVHILLADDALAGDELPTGGAVRGVGVNVRIMVDDVDAVYERCRTNGVRIVWPIADKDYGLRDFIMADPYGYMLRFASPLGG
jgi:uncharacterized glyoxalase superfamily protein PhnB